jgi:hypothetical protein
MKAAMWWRQGTYLKFTESGKTRNIHALVLYESWNISVSIAMGYGLDDRNSIPGRENGNHGSFPVG